MNRYFYVDLVDQTTAFIIKGVRSQWKQPVSFIFSSGPLNEIDLKKQVISVITAYQQSGLNVVATVCDQSQANSTAINSILDDTARTFRSRNEENINHGFLINNQEVVFLYDVPHLFQKNSE